MARRSGTVLLAGALVVSGTLAVAPQADAGEPTGPGALVRLETKSFKSQSGVKVRAEIGRLAVPEYRGNPAGRSIELAFVRLRSESGHPAAPLVYLAGGPGGSATWMAEEPPSLEEWIPALEVCDVILLDQRGTGRSTP